VQTGSFGGVTSLFLRGGQSKYVKVLVDGVPVNEPGGAFDFAHLTTDNVERIEVLRGPASVLYGSDAVTGVVQIFTRRGVGAARWGRCDTATTGTTFRRTGRGSPATTTSSTTGAARLWDSRSDAASARGSRRACSSPRTRPRAAWTTGPTAPPT